ncbi:MAG: hypothetical protein ACE5EA_02610 [Nitrospirota bacterium]
MGKSRLIVLLLLTLVLPLLILSDNGFARDFKVYGYNTPKKGETELSYWIDYFIKSDNKYRFLDNNFIDKEKLFRHTFEIEYGLTDRWTISGYIDFEDPKGENLEYVQARAVITRYRFFEKGERFFDSAIYFEYYIPDEKYKSSEHLETMIIFEKEISKIALILNSKFDKKLSGDDVVKEGMEFEYSAGVYYPISSTIKTGLEFHGKFGELRNFKSFDEQEHLIFPTVDMKLAKYLNANLGIGVGLTDNSDDLVFKVIFEYELE